MYGEETSLLYLVEEFVEGNHRLYRDINKTRLMGILFATDKTGLHLFVTFRNNRACFSWKKERMLKNVPWF